MLYSLGCKKSVLTGKETKYQVPQKYKLPASYNYIGTMPPVINQGSKPICVACAISSLLDWKKNLKEKDNNGGQFSLDTIYNCRKNKNADGMEINEALYFLKHTGINGFKLNDYGFIGSPMFMKYAILANGPCPVALPVYEENQNKDFWNGNVFLGNHCVLCVGYNENGYILRNSWGTNFGNKGYILLPYNNEDKFIEMWTFL